MAPTFIYALGDYVGVVKGRSAGVKGRITQIRKKVVVVSVRSKRASYRVKAHSMVLLERTSMTAAHPIEVGTDVITEFIDKKVGAAKNVHMVTLEEWRRLQKDVERKFFDVNE